MGTKKTVSLCMIIKDEEATLEKAIRSVQQFVDEIVIGIDETTNDRSEDIAKEFTNKVYRFNFQRNFAEARNRMLVHCTKEWILQLDGHEYLDEKCAPLFVRMLENIPDDVDAVGFRLKMQEEDGNYSGIQLRLFRNNGKIKYRNSVHNVLTVDDTRTIGFSDIIIRHERPKHNREIRNVQRNRMVPEEMRKVLEQNPCDTRAMYYVALHAQDAGDYGRAIVYYRRYLAFSKHPEERYKVLWQMGRCLYLSGRKDEARKTFIQGITERYDLAECYVSLGELAMEEQKWGEAEHYFKLACDRQMPVSGIFFSEDFYSWIPYHKLCELYERNGEYYKAVCTGEILLKQKNLPDKRRREVEMQMFRWYGAMVEWLEKYKDGKDRQNKENPVENSCTSAGKSKNSDDKKEQNNYVELQQ